MASSKITVWHRIDERKQTMVFNHISNGWYYQDRPQPNCEHQRKAWNGARWLSYTAYLINNKVVM
ncbi:hypothetical protein KAR91_46390 [Candidatus Pacearchaeota archaeon]|nr:hypothetical protein [Candidatus Pacearchaeota archaeon]